MIPQPVGPCIRGARAPASLKAATLALFGSCIRRIRGARAPASLKLDACRRSLPSVPEAFRPPLMPSGERRGGDRHGAATSPRIEGRAPTLSRLLLELLRDFQDVGASGARLSSSSVRKPTERAGSARIDRPKLPDFGLQERQIFDCCQHR